MAAQRTLLRGGPPGRFMPATTPEIPKMARSSAQPVATNIPNDLEAFWMPFTANRAFKQRPRMIARAKDMYCLLYTSPSPRD